MTFIYPRITPSPGAARYDLYIPEKSAEPAVAVYDLYNSEDMNVKPSDLSNVVSLPDAAIESLKMPRVGLRPVRDSHLECLVELRYL